MKTLYIVTLTEGTQCKARGLEVEYRGHEAYVTVRSAAEREAFWANRFAFLKANPNA